ncbi:MAG: 2-C-methyl-D-erythritol 2,4-cyclodiphosphate synthase [Actinomycetota bacterium]
MTIRVGLGFDVHPFAPDRPLVLGGVTIPDATGLAGHSDADAVAHAVADALLGAAGLPDLGTLYPASDDLHLGAASVGFLVEIARRLAADGWTVGNVDVVIAAEQPRLAPHVAAIATGVAQALEAARDPSDAVVAVSVTPKRGEGLGAIGRAEGIAAWAVALLQR